MNKLFKKLSIVLFSFILPSCSFSYEESDKQESNITSETTEITTEETDVDGYFFDSDSSSGDGSFEHPYSDLSLISSLDFQEKRNVYLKRGSQFKGSLSLSDVSGSEEKPIVITSYGEGERPKIDGDNLVGSGVLSLTNCSHIFISDLELFDSASEEGDRRGVYLLANNPDNNSEVKTYKDITIENLYIHDIHGITDKENSGMSSESKRTGGIHFGSLDGKGRFSSLTFRKCKIERVSNVGIASWYQIGALSKKISPYSAKFKDYAHTDVTIEENEICYIGKNAIFARNLLGGHITKNLVYETAIECVSGNSIVTSYVDGTVVEYNEGHHNRATVRESDGKLQDGCMLDADLQSKDTIWQYNYSHDNSFGLFLNCTSYDETNGILDHVIVRYNLSVNDLGNKGIIYINYKAKMIEVYNNTIVTGYDTKTIFQTNSQTNSMFANNLIYNRSSKALFNLSSTSNIDISNNLVYSIKQGQIEQFNDFSNRNTDGVYQDPSFITEIPEDAENDMMSAVYYQLSEDSCAYGSAREIEEVPDFFGNQYKNCIGFCCV